MPPRLSKERVREMFSNIRAAEELHAPWISEGWNNIAYAEGRPGRGGERMGASHEPGMPATRVPINLFHANYKSTAPRLFPRRWRSRVHPTDAQFDAGAQILEAILAWNQRVTKWGVESRMAVTNSLFYGRGYLRHGFHEPQGGMPEAFLEKRRGAATVYNAQAREKLVKAGIEDVVEEMRFEASGIEPPEAERASLRRPRLHTNRHVLANRPYTIAIAPEDVLWDPWADSLYTAGWCVQMHYWKRPQLEEYGRRRRVSVSEIPSYSFQEVWPYVGTRAEPMRGKAWMEEHAQEMGDETENDVVKLYEYMDFEHGMWVLLAEGQEDAALEVRRWPFPSDDFPFSILDLHERQGLLYPISDFTYHQSKQDTINLFMASFVLRIARSKKILGYQKALSDEDELKEALNAESLGMVGFTQPVEAALKMIDMTEDADALLGAIENLKMQDRIEWGSPAEEHGQPSKVKSATQAAMLHGRAEMTNEWRQELVTYWQEDASEHQGLWIQRMWPLMQQAGAVTPEKLIGSRSIFRGAQGLNLSGKIIRVEGLSLDEVEADYRYQYECDLDSKRGRYEKAQRILDTANVLHVSGRVNWDAVADKIVELGDFGMMTFLTPPREVPSAAKEHELILMGQMPQIDPQEDLPAHIMEHGQLLQDISKVQSARNSGMEMDPRQVRPMVMLFLRQPQAVMVLFQHLEETKAKHQGGAAPGKSASGGAADYNMATKAAATRSAETQQEAGVRPGNVNKNIGNIQAGMG